MSLPIVPDYDNGDADDDSLYSIISTSPGLDTATSPSEYGHDDVDDDFEQFSLDGDGIGDGDGVNSEISCGCSTSVTPSAYEDEVAYGRRYHGFRKGRYPLPNDDLEQRREETNHALMLELTVCVLAFFGTRVNIRGIFLDSCQTIEFRELMATQGGRLFYSDIGKYPHKIIDIGTGTGTWAIDVADQYPSASVVGTDLSPIQPKWVPVNVRMYVDDCEEPDWLHGSNFDMVHFRGMAGTLRDLDRMLNRTYPHVRDGGWVEFHEFIPQILCDDGTMSEEDPVRIFFDASTQGLRTFGGEPLRALNLEETLVGAGFTNIHVITKKVPIAAWPRDKHLKTVGMFTRAVILDSLGALAAKPLAALGIPSEDRRALVTQVKRSLNDRRIHRYMKFVICYGQKKENSESASPPLQ
ncbi:Secondary metabolism regulator LAE1 [Metarhizium brunneum]|uniref:Secondary metabolism regulator LAE1 n=1 Tax=Metarhizium brunneum TaxID=500148 RepID=A0A7D5UXV6_9HYPO|nr:Secondary metabolism regulator LAE1 [Metarhizium brunneum]